MAIVIGVYFAGLTVLGEPASAHEPNEPSLELTVVDIEIIHETLEHEDHCHGSGYCGGSAMIFPSLASTQKKDRANRYGIPGATKAFPAVTSSDPPPPRRLV